MDNNGNESELFERCNKQRSYVDNALNKCSYWLENKCSLEDNESLTSDSSTNLSQFSGSSLGVSEFPIDKRDDFIPFNNLAIGQDHTLSNEKTKQIDTISVYKSKNVHIGDITYIKGPVKIKQYLSNTIYNDKKTTQVPDKVPYVLITRRNWLAQPPMNDLEPLEEPAKFVIIAHSATEEALTQADNTLIVRLIQTFHIESRKWDDIGYNFLIGSDGNVYEGRGWNVRGAHTKMYNRFSVGICFIGCFIRNLPSSASLAAAKALIRHGVQIGTIAENYRLLGHCQCNGFESPGRRLFEEIQTWNNWDGSINVNNPPETL